MAREANLTTGTGPSLRARVRGKGMTKINCGLLEYLRGNLVPPSKSSHLFGDGAVGGDDEHPASVLALLPRVEGIDEVVPGPGYLDQWVKSLRGECVSDEP